MHFPFKFLLRVLLLTSLFLQMAAANLHAQIRIVEDSVICNNGQYQFKFRVENNSPSALISEVLIEVVAPTPAGVSISPAFFSYPAIAQGGTSIPLVADIIGPLNAGDQFCITARIKSNSPIFDEGCYPVPACGPAACVQLSDTPMECIDGLIDYTVVINNFSGSSIGSVRLIPDDPQIFVNLNDFLNPAQYTNPALTNVNILPGGQYALEMLMYGPGVVPGQLFSFTLEFYAGPNGSGALLCTARAENPMLTVEAELDAQAFLGNCPTMCDNLSLSATPIVENGDTCCWQFSLNNTFEELLVNQITFTSVNGTPLSPVLFDPGAWTVATTNSAPTFNLLPNPPGPIPMGNSGPVFRLCGPAGFNGAFPIAAKWFVRLPNNAILRECSKNFNLQVGCGSATTCEDLISQSGWSANTTAISITNGNVVFANVPGYTNPQGPRIYRSATLPNNGWKTEFKFRATDVCAPIGAALLPAVATAGTLQPSGFPAETNQDALGVLLFTERFTQSPIYLTPYIKNGTQRIVESCNIPIQEGVDYRVRLERLSLTNGKLTVFNAAGTTEIGSCCFDIPATLVGLNTLQAANFQLADPNRCVSGITEEWCNVQAPMGDCGGAPATCVTILQDSVFCENDVVKMRFTIKNNSTSAIQSIKLNAPNQQISFTPNVLNTNIPAGQTVTLIPDVLITGSGATAGKEFCYLFEAFAGLNASNKLPCIDSITDNCKIIPACTPLVECDKLSVIPFLQNQVNYDTCCYRFLLENNNPPGAVKRLTIVAADGALFEYGACEPDFLLTPLGFIQTLGVGIEHQSGSIPTGGLPCAITTCLPSGQTRQFNILWFDAAGNELCADSIVIGCPPPQTVVCDSLSANLRGLTVEDQNPCTFGLNIQNNAPAGSIQSLNFTSTQPIVVSSAGNNWNLGLSFPNFNMSANFNGGSVPTGYDDVVFNFEVPAGTTQQIIVQWKNPAGAVLCRDTVNAVCPALNVDCEQLSVIPSLDNQANDDTCCYRFLLENNNPPGAVKRLTIVAADGALFEYGACEPDFLLTPLGFIQTLGVGIEHQSGSIPTGGLPCAITTCLPSGQTRQFNILWFDAAGNELCADSIVIGCPPPQTVVCDSLSANLRGLTVEDQNPCTFGLNIQNNAPAGSIQSLNFTSTQPIVVSSAGNNWNLGLSFPNFNMSANYNGGSVPTGYDDVVFNFEVPAGTTQQIIVEWKNAAGEIVCRDTLNAVCPTPQTVNCDSLGYQFISTTQEGQDTCLFGLELLNYELSGILQAVTFSSNAPIQVQGAGNGWTLTPNGNNITATHAGGVLPSGTSLVFNFVVPAGQSQAISINWQDAGGNILCTQTLLATCPDDSTGQEDPCANCSLTLSGDELLCAENGGLEYRFFVNNNWNQAIRSLRIIPVDNALAVVPMELTFPAPGIAPGAVAGPFSVQINGNVAPGTPFCYTLEGRELPLDEDPRFVFRDTLNTGCRLVPDCSDPEEPQGLCVPLLSDSLSCSGGALSYTFTITNPAGNTFPITHLRFRVFDQDSLRFFVENIALTPPLQPGQSRTLTVPVWIHGMPEPGDQFCFALEAYDGNTPENWPTLGCDTLCVPLPACACETECYTCCTEADLRLPTGLSPNGDNKNDVYKVLSGEKACGPMEMRVLNQWGNVVWQSDDYRNDWDGSNQEGVPLPESTYFVLVRIKSTGLTISTFVDLRRR
ncbi:MAG: gliding motility-associated C-terminal domain-containing protein [Chitinophagales bacterium]|nr:gliding motility-associated C-terminal domain-containing protein [Chitinophagales bacterium]